MSGQRVPFGPESLVSVYVPSPWELDSPDELFQPLYLEHDLYSADGQIKDDYLQQARWPEHLAGPLGRLDWALRRLQVYRHTGRELIRHSDDSARWGWSTSASNVLHCLRGCAQGILDALVELEAGSPQRLLAITEVIEDFLGRIAAIEGQSPAAMRAAKRESAQDAIEELEGMLAALKIATTPEWAAFVADVMASVGTVPPSDERGGGQS